MVVPSVPVAFWWPCGWRVYSPLLPCSTCSPRSNLKWKCLSWAFLQLLDVREALILQRMKRIIFYLFLSAATGNIQSLWLLSNKCVHKQRSFINKVRNICQAGLIGRTLQILLFETVDKINTSFSHTVKISRQKWELKGKYHTSVRKVLFCFEECFEMIYKSDLLITRLWGHFGKQINMTFLRKRKKAKLFITVIISIIIFRIQGLI